MTESDNRTALVRSYDVAADVVAGIRPDQLGQRTPCPEYDVACLVDHLVGASRRAAALGRGEAPTGEAFPHIELADAPLEIRQAGKEAEAAWSEDGRLASTVDMPWGETYTGATLVNMYLAEIAAHAWDLAVATGQVPRLDAALAPSALGAARAMLKREYRDAMSKGNPYGPEVAAPKDATDWERFAAFMGRPPRDWQPAS